MSDTLTIFSIIRLAITTGAVVGALSLQVALAQVIKRNVQPRSAMGWLFAATLLTTSLWLAAFAALVITYNYCCPMLGGFALLDYRVFEYTLGASFSFGIITVPVPLFLLGLVVVKFKRAEAK